MTDKVQKIREGIEKLKSRLIRGACASQITMETRCKEEAYNEVLTILDSLQEESVSIWHDSNEEQPNFASTVVAWNPKYKTGEIISRCTEVYSDRIWAYIDDLLKI